MMGAGDQQQARLAAAQAAQKTQAAESAQRQSLAAAQAAQKTTQ